MDLVPETVCLDRVFVPNHFITVRFSGIYISGVPGMLQEERRNEMQYLTSRSLEFMGKADSEHKSCWDVHQGGDAGYEFLGTMHKALDSKLSVMVHFCNREPRRSRQENQNFKVILNYIEPKDSQIYENLSPNKWKIKSVKEGYGICQWIFIFLYCAFSCKVFLAAFELRLLIRVHAVLGLIVAKLQNFPNWHLKNSKGCLSEIWLLMKWSQTMCLVCSMAIKADLY